MILSKIDSLYRQPNLFRLFLSTSSVLEHELKTHISDVLKTIYLLLMQIGCFHIYKKLFQPLNHNSICTLVLTKCNGYITIKVISTLHLGEER